MADGVAATKPVVRPARVRTLDGMLVGEDVVDAGVTGADPRLHRHSR